MGLEQPNPRGEFFASQDDKFRRLLEAAPDALILVDRAGRILLTNSQSDRLFGYPKEELLLQPIEILIPEHSRPGHAQHRAAYHAAPSYRPMGTGLELSGRRKDGSVFPAEISLSPWEDEGEQLVLASIRDVTEKKLADEKLRLSEERFRSLVQEVRDYGIFMLDPEGNVVSWNEGAQKIKGYEADEIIGKHFSLFYTSEDIERGRPEEGLRIAASEGRWEEEGWRIHKDGSRFWASVVIASLHDKDGSLLGFAKVTRDITEGKRAREAFLLEVTNALVSNLDVRQLLSAIAACLRQVKPFDYGRFLASGFVAVSVGRTCSNVNDAEYSAASEARYGNTAWDSSERSVGNRMCLISVLCIDCFETFGPAASTGQGNLRKSSSATEPMRRCLNPVRPWVPTMTRSMSC